MKISIKWLKDYVSFQLPAEKLAHKLTMAGLEVEKIEDAGDDVILEMEVTPNRPDCLNFQGIARELSAVLDKPLKLPKVKKLLYPKTRCDIEIADQKDCGRYIGTVLEPVQVKASPDWIGTRLSALGGRLINNVVDITNFCLLETGQPLHAFDYDKLIGGKIVVRRAKAGEKIVTLDGVERALDPSVLVIADAQRPVAIAGIMGGLATEVTNQTRKILLESAYFDPVLIRRASRLLGLKSDSSYRFERGVDFATVEAGAARAVSLILTEAGGGVVARRDVNPGRVRAQGKSVTVSLMEINELLGSELTVAKCRTILKKLNFRVSAGGPGVLKVVAPSVRADIKDPVDVIEEIARVVGYDNLPLTLPLVRAQNVPPQPEYPFAHKLRDIFIGQGYNETVSYSLLSQGSLDKSGLSGLPVVRVKNPLSLDQEVMRPSLFPSLLGIVRSNIHRGQKDNKIFEIGKIYLGQAEYKMLAVMGSGTRDKDWRALHNRAWDFYDLKGALDQMFARLGLTAVVYEACEDPFFKKGTGASIRAGKTALGRVGEVDRGLLQQWDIKHRAVFYAQCDFEALYKLASKKPSFKKFSEFPGVTRDISLAVKEDVSFQKVKEVILKQGGALLEDVAFLEEYRGEKIQPGYKGFIFSIVYRSSLKTLTEEDISIAHGDIAQALIDQLGVVMR
jgi:phenylalanyl-tRNA synthetase beta chain